MIVSPFYYIVNKDHTIIEDRLSNVRINAPEAQS
jgi:hypothetical protein